MDPNIALLISIKLAKLAMDAIEHFSLGENEAGMRKLTELAQASADHARAAREAWEAAG